MNFFAVAILMGFDPQPYIVSVQAKLAEERRRERVQRMNRIEAWSQALGGRAQGCRFSGGDDQQLEDFG